MRKLNLRLKDIHLATVVKRPGLPDTRRNACLCERDQVWGDSPRLTEDPGCVTCYYCLHTMGAK